MWHPFKRKPKLPFTGTCLVKQTTHEGFFVGRCWHSTYGGVCHVHGDVSKWLSDDPTDTSVGWYAWPHDYDLEPNR